MEMSRRDVLKVGVLSSAALLLPIERVARTKSAAAGAIDQKFLPNLKFKAPLPSWAAASPTAMVDVPGVEGKVAFYEMAMKQAPANILNKISGSPVTKPTNIWGYGGTTPGPLIRVRKGQRTIVRQINGMKGVKHPTLGYEPVTSVHLHGSASLPEYDGYASDVTKPDEFKDYHYPNIQDARTLWYHDHGVHQTASNAYMGLAAQYQIYDDNEIKLANDGYLPFHNKYDVPLTVRDAIFGTNGQLIYDDNSESSVMGDVILVNGAPWPVMKVERRKYRFRILNASVSRSYRFALSTGDPVTFVATDGGLMPYAQKATSWRHGMAERYEVIIDFAKYTVGQRVVLRNLSLPNNVDYDSTKDVMAFDVVDGIESQQGNLDIPEGYVLNANPDVMALPDGPTAHSFQLVRTNGSWTVNGSTWVDVVDSDYGEPLYSPEPGASEVWEIKNPSGGWFHPFHIHLVDFRILSRNGKPPFPYELGPKDVVYVGENETVRVALKLRGPDGALNADAQKCYDEEATRLAGAWTGQRTGRYMVHCHNLVHEDHDMMGQFWVGGPPETTHPRGNTSASEDPHHPVEAAKARSWNANLSGAPDLDNFKGF
ncbi:MAG TPA: multicopper oxidase domain-containing protein [Solirubrobacteraceae bacterium]|nr:multicopper oxidase domain-containing protein [Solirubrobacteraceae bacterium]